MLSDLEQIDHTSKAGSARQRWRDVRKFDPPDRRDDDVAGTEWIAPAFFDMRSLPDAHAARNFAAHDRFAKALGELHFERSDVFRRNRRRRACATALITLGYERT